MKKKSLTVVFFGSGPVAAKSLRLLNRHVSIEAVITKPRPAHHQGEVPVLALGQELRLPVYTASDKSSLDTLLASHNFSSKLAVLVDFGILVSAQAINHFPLGIVNSHFSLLPEWRGADPITFSILSGQEQTGVSLMLLSPQMDTGPLLAQGPHLIEEQTATPELTDELIELSDALLAHILPLYASGEVVPYDQLSGTISGTPNPTYSRRLTKEDGIIDWHKSAAQLEREIRAFQGWPKSRTSFGALPTILISAHVIDASGPPGMTIVLKKEPVIYCGEQALAIKRIKPAGKPEMSGQAFLAGYKSLFLEGASTKE